MASKLASRTLIYIMGDEDTVTGLLLAGIGNHDSLGQTNYYITDSRTTNLGLEETFTKYIHQKDIAILLVTQQIANKIRPLVEAFESNNNPFPAILEIPSKELPYDPEKDSMMKRVQKLFTAD